MSNTIDIQAKVESEPPEDHPPVCKDRTGLRLEVQPALLIYDVCRGHTTNTYLKDNKMLSKIPPNMKNVFQPLDLTVNMFAKDFMKGKFSTWFSQQDLKMAWN